MRHIPNLLTCGNLVCGCLGIISLWEGNHVPAAYYVWGACIFDFFDGFSARLLRTSSPIGRELDSMADVVSFGAFPALFMYKLITSVSSSHFLPYIAILIAVCSAIRLAVFNLDEMQSDSFRGLPTPANALFLTSLPFLSTANLDFIFTPAALTIITIGFSLLLVSRFELFALKFKNFGWVENKIRFTFLLIAVLLLAFLHLAALPVIIILYILLSLGGRMITK